jgi:predicted amino acid dehydrogenase
MGSFAVVVHPLDPKEDVGKVYPRLARLLPAPVLHLLARRWPPLVLSRIGGLRSVATASRAEGWLLGSPLTAAQMFRLPPQAVYDKAVQVGRLAQKQGAQILGLGATASAVGDGGVTVAQRLNMPVTTGRSLVVGFGVEALRRAAEERGLEMGSSTTAIVGASGTVGLAMAEMLAPLVRKLILVGQREIRVSQARAQAEAAGASEVRVWTEIGALEEADIVVTATSAHRPVVGPEALKERALVCDVALPPDVAPAVREERPDVTVISGAMVEMPGTVDLGFDLGYPEGQVRAGLAEAMVLALEGRYESTSLGQRITIDRVEELVEMAKRHGFRLPSRGALQVVGT